MQRISSSIDTLRDYFARICDTRMAQGHVLREPSRPIKTIAMIGATTDTANGAMMGRNDERILYQTHQSLIDQGIRLARDFNIIVVNLDPAHGGRDYIEEATPAELATFCFIYNPSPKNIRIDKPEFGIGALHHEQNIWHDTAARSGTHFLSIAIGEQSSVYDQDLRDLGPRHFLPQGGVFEQINNHDYRSHQTLLKRRDYQF